MVDTLIKSDASTALNEYFRQRNITPTEKQFLQMIKNDSIFAGKNILVYFKNKINDKIKNYAVKIEPALIKYIDNSSKEMQQKVLEKNPYNMKYIKEKDLNPELKKKYQSEFKKADKEASEFVKQFNL